MGSKRTTSEVNEASGAQQAGLELCIIEGLLVSKNIPVWQRQVLHRMIMGPMLKAIEEKPALVHEEILPKMRKLHDQLDRSIKRIEQQLERGAE